MRARLDRPDAWPADPVLLSLRDSEFTTTALGGSCSALRDAGPDSWGRFLIERLHGPQSELGYLRLAAGERTGTLDFSKARETPPPVSSALNGTDKLLEAARAMRAAEGNAKIPQRFVQPLACGISNGRARPKFTILHEGKLWIAKFPSIKDSLQYPSMPLRECAALNLATRCGIAVPQHHLIDASGVPVLLIRRFDRRGRDRLPDERVKRSPGKSRIKSRASATRGECGTQRDTARLAGGRNIDP